MENTARPNGFIRLNREFCEGKLKPFYVKTYRYIFPLYKNVKIDLKELEYPKYDKGFEYVDDYKHSLSLLARAFILAEILNQKDDAKVIQNYLIKNYNIETVYDILSSALSNKSIVEIATNRKCEKEFKKVKNYILGLLIF